MGGILSQDEIDALMTAVSSGDLVVSPADSAFGAQNVQPYDFRQPNRMSKENLRALTSVHESFVRLLANNLSGYLRCIVETSLVSVTNVSFAEFQQSLPNPSGITVLNSPPFEGPVVLEMNQPLLVAMIDRLFGGPGTLGQDGRALTALEQTVIQKIVRRVLPELADSWKTIISLDPNIELFESNPQFVTVASPGDMVVFASMEIQLPKASGFASLCYLHRDVEDALHHSGSSHGANLRQKRPIPIPAETWHAGIAPTTLDLTGILGSTRIRVGELLDLRVGDVLRLDSSPAGDLPVRVAGEEKARARLGRIGRHRALEITALH